MHTRPLLIGAGFLAATCSIPNAKAELVTVQFTGEISSVTSEGTVDFSDDFSFGSSVRGYFIFDNSIADNGQGAANIGNYPAAMVEFGLSINDVSDQTIDDYGIRSTTTRQITVANSSVFNDFSGDHFYFTTNLDSGQPLDGAAPSFVIFQLSDTTNNVLPNNAAAKSLTPTYDFAQFNDGEVTVIWTDPLRGGSGNAGEGQVDISFESVFVLPDCSPDRDIVALTDAFPGTSIDAWTIMDPAGIKIAFVDNGNWTGQNADGSEEYFILDIATQVITQITDTTSLSLSGPQASFTADGSILAFQTFDPDNGNEYLLQTYNTVTDTLSPLFSSFGSFISEPRITDDGTRIYFRSELPNDTDPDTSIDNVDQSSELFCYNTTNFTYTQLTDTQSGADIESFTVSGDGSTVIVETSANFVPPQNADGSREFFKIDLGTGMFTQLTDGTDNGLTMRGDSYLTTDGSQFAFISSRDLTGENPTTVDQVFIMDLDTMAVNQLTNNTNEFLTQVNGLSRDGSTVIFESEENLTGENPQAVIQYMKIDVATETITQISNFQFGGENTQCSVNSDGTLVAFEASRSPLACVPSVGSQLYLATMPTTQPCPADFDDDNTVGTSDFFALLQNWGTCADPQACPWDIAPGSGDWGVGTDDFFLLLQSWGPCD